VKVSVTEEIVTEAIFVRLRSLSINGHCRFALLVRKVFAQTSHTHTAQSTVFIAGERVVRRL